MRNDSNEACIQIQPLQLFKVMIITTSQTSKHTAREAALRLSRSKMFIIFLIWGESMLACSRCDEHQRTILLSESVNSPFEEENTLMLQCTVRKYTLQAWTGNHLFTISVLIASTASSTDPSETLRNTMNFRKIKHQVELHTIHSLLVSESPHNCLRKRKNSLYPFGREEPLLCSSGWATKQKLSSQ